jgi:hypothetical protein
MPGLLREFFALCPDGVCDVSVLTEQERQLVKEKKAFYMTGVIQKADHLNGNGRWYPEAVLRREMQNYEKLVKENRALGECVDDQTQILTSEGWKYLEDIKNDELVYTFDAKKEEIQLQQIEAKIERSFEGNLLHFSNKAGTLDMALTPNHKIMFYDRYNKQQNMPAADLAALHNEGDSGISHSSIRKIGGVWRGDEPTHFEFSGQTIQADVWAAFLGFWIAEGHLATSNQIYVSQRKKEMIEELRLLFAQLPFEVKENNTYATSRFHFANEEMHSYLRKLGKSYEKYIPDGVKSWSPRLLNILLEWMLKGDGRNRKNPNGKLMRELYTTSFRLAEDVMEIFFKLNSSANISVRKQKDRLIEGRLIKEENSRLLYIASEYTAKSISLDKRFVKIDKVPYKGKVFCVTTPNGNWLMRRNGHACWTGNCDHPDSSVINLKNASHLVTQVWWNGKDVMGKLRVLNTPSGQILKSLVNEGVQLGISSRALGSVREENGKTIVEDDLQLICFDMVSDPSTVGAFMQLAENKEPNIFTKADRIYRLLNDIVGDHNENI